jgi:hypothetical protein
MVRLLRRLVLASLLIGGVVFVARRRGLCATASKDDAAWPPIQDERRGFVQVDSTGDADGTARWVPPVDGRCPDGFPIKANGSSGIFHVPGGRFYDRTIPERCYAEADAAVADGYRAAKA